MMHMEAYMPILAAAATDVVVGMVWYSDHLFGPMWKKAGGKAPGKDMTSKIAMHAAVAVLTASALFIAISVFQKTQTGMYAQEGFLKIFSFFLQDNVQDNTLMSSMKTAGFIWLGFLVPCKALCTIWGSGNWHKFMIEAAGQLASFVAMAAVIARLS